LGRKRLILSLLLLPPLLYLGLCTLLFFAQTGLLFPTGQVGPAGALPPGAERLTLAAASGERLAGLHIPPARGAVLQQGHHRQALDLRPGRAPAQLDKRRRDVERGHHALDASAGLHERRITHEERRADAFLVREPPLRAEAMLAEEEAVVAEEDDARVVQRARFL